MDQYTDNAKYRFLVYGIEQKGLTAPDNALKRPNYELVFASRRNAPRFQEFDGVIVFQGTFESVKQVQRGFGLNLEHSCDLNELDKRTKEVDALVEKGGIVCVLLCEPLLDTYDRQDIRRTDVAKRLLDSCALNRFNFTHRQTHIKSLVNDFNGFFKLYGAAWSKLDSRYGVSCALKTIASVGNEPVSTVYRGQVFFVPVLTPEGQKVTEFFVMLTDALVRTWQKLRDDVPDWLAQYQLPEEVPLIARQQGLRQELNELEKLLEQIRRYKRVLSQQGEPLVDAVIDIMTRLGLKTERREAFREDVGLLDHTGNEIALLEVKGTNGGVQREHVNQADNHRERAGRRPDYPSLLIINTRLKSTSMADKDKAVEVEQILHAVRNNVVILRTLDLLNLSCMCASGKLSPVEVLKLFTSTRGGWLKVSSDAVTLIQK